MLDQGEALLVVGRQSEDRLAEPLADIRDLEKNGERVEGALKGD